METKPIQIDLIENVPRVSAMIIADNTNVKYESIRELIRRYKTELEIFGEIPTADFKSAVGKMAKQVSILNEQQATLLMTFLKNTKEVVEFKVNLVKAFFLMKEKLQNNLLETNNQELTKAMSQMLSFREDMHTAISETNKNMAKLKDYVMEKLYLNQHDMQRVISASESTSKDVSSFGCDLIEIQLKVNLLEAYHRKDTLSPVELTRIRKAIREKARQLSKEHRMSMSDVEILIYTRLKKNFDVYIYYEIKSVSFAEALNFIENFKLDYEDYNKSTYKEEVEDEEEEDE